MRPCLRRLLIRIHLPLPTRILHHSICQKIRKTVLAPEMLLVMQSFPSDVQAQIFIAVGVETMAVRFREAGGQGIYILAGLGDVHIDGGPVVIATAQPGRRPEEIQQFFGVTIKEIAENPSHRTLHPYIKQLDVQQKSGAVLVGMKGTVARYANMKSAERTELTSPLVRTAGEGASLPPCFVLGPIFAAWCENYGRSCPARWLL